MSVVDWWGVVDWLSVVDWWSVVDWLSAAGRLSIGDQPFVVDHDAAILDDRNSGLTESLGGRSVMNAKLHPDRARALGEGQDFVNMTGNVFSFDDCQKLISGPLAQQDRAADF